jgi:hypothetical protein
MLGLINIYNIVLYNNIINNIINNILSIIYYMSYSIIAPQALVGIPLPTSDEINNPMDFMKYVVKRHNMIEGINRTNFF